MVRPPSSSSPMAEALDWVSRISTVGLMMVLPIIGGRWLDERLLTTYWSPIGLVVGLAVGTWQITNLARLSQRRSSAKNEVNKKSKPSDSEPKT